MRLLVNILIVFAFCALMAAAGFGAAVWRAELAVLAVSNAQEVPVIWNEAESWRLPDGTMLAHGTKVAWPRMIDYGPVLAEELSVYPKGLLERLGIRQLLLACDLRDEGEQLLGGRALGRDRIILNADGSDVPHYASSNAIHHEIFHIIDRWGYARDKEWEAGSRYYAKDESRGTWNAPSTVSGFIDNYSRSCPGEDKAQVYANLIIRYRSLASLAAKDPVLARKVALMKARLAGLKLGFDDAFWARMQARPLAGAEWALEPEGERLRLEPPAAPL
jgi:hypothetical protein